MTLFSSRPPFNNDPQPWRAQDFTGRTYDHRVADENGAPASAARLRMGYIHDPRPEYARTQHNPSNPILVQTRSDISLAPGAAHEIIAAQLDLLNAGDDYWNLDVVTGEHIEHARRVLIRLITDDDPDDACRECGEEIDYLDMHAGYGMCGSCVHNAVRSGWDPSEPEAA
ncbi:hypothetical protein FM104_12905 [Microbacterium esteraromaticum]|uniref:Uncharacterized protein n=1 Tax=Microbacterium esteraromaticum TaxID=57043 RepID=A0A1R4KHN4_9MICO|nr:hypothetical protein [Microbacterium esteraromaticum]SJN43752.1 hypothetical protein FM104_12905 [Microbacterium esteraromaticum]